MAWSHNLFCSCYRSDTAEGCDSEYQYPVAHIDSQAERSWHSGNLDHIVLSDPHHGLPVLSLLLPGEWVPSRQTRRPPPLAVRIDLSNATDSTSRRRKYLFLPLALSDRFGYIDPTAGHSISPRCTSAPFQHRNTGRETVCCRQKIVPTHAAVPEGVFASAFADLETIEPIASRPSVALGPRCEFWLTGTGTSRMLTGNNVAILDFR